MKNYLPKKCACCGITFNTIGNSKRKYCSHACYITERYGKEAYRDKCAI
jgi:hypothetical protein